MHEGLGATILVKNSLLNCGANRTGTPGQVYSMLQNPAKGNLRHLYAGMSDRK